MACFPASGAVYVASPGDDIKTMAANLVPGDTLRLHGGTYDTDGFWLGNKAGTAALPVVIEAYPGEKPVMNCIDYSRNCIDISNCSYLTLRGLEVKGSGGDGAKSTANTTNDHITIEYCIFHDVIGCGIDTKGNDSYWLVRYNEIYNTNVTGEAMYFGTNSSTTYILHESIVEYNYIHNTGGSQGDGIEIKWGGHGNIIRHNVLHNVRQPSIITQLGDPASPNIVEGNVIMDCTVDAGIQVYRNTIVRNNIIMNTAMYGIAVRPMTSTTKNITIVNNTFYNCKGAVYVSDADTSVVVANNACYELSTAQEAMVLVNSSVTSSGNVYYGTLNGSWSGCTPGNAPNVDMEDPAGMDFWPTASSALVDTATAGYAPTTDFNGSPRPFGTGYDVGAYERSVSNNPGWMIQKDFKQLIPYMPDVTAPTITIGSVAISVTVTDGSALKPLIWIDGVSYPMTGGTYTSSWLSVSKGQVFAVEAEDVFDNRRRVDLKVDW
jgi:hypothetical protein